MADLQVRGRPVKIWAIGAGAVVLAISAAFGGLNKAEAENPPLAAGTAVNAGQFEVTVQRVVTVTDLKPLFTPEPGGALIAVVTKLKVTDDTGATPPSDLIRLIGVPGLEDDARPVGTATLDDNTQSPVLTPDAAEDVAYVFKLPKLSELPTEAKVTVQGYEHYDESLLDHHEKWLPADIVAEGTIKVTDKTKPSKS
ncbi:hypothetical protein HPO96_21915 [Kribbella sandramycini]|uniref:Uncharacterized protein n=1 Tax=Kribbella sandramycini TaxID=60450 RepID=A0A7Y4L250_9ACTN|nr:hypothetical protein [Kribbella sandramycini]NOL42907.1 hypothetical protein [Kribbella sandramycini]